MKPNDKALAQHAVDRFVRRFGNPSYRDLAYYAALPFILTPELLNYLRHAFLRGLNPPLPWVAEADLLLSDLCSQVGHEQFAMKQVIRDYLMTQMRQRLGSKRLEEVARLLLRYVNGLKLGGSPFGERELQTQELGAMLCIDDQRVAAVRELAMMLQREVALAATAPDGWNQGELSRLARLTQGLSAELNEYPELLLYADQCLRALGVEATTIPSTLMETPARVDIDIMTVAASPLRVADIELPELRLPGRRQPAITPSPKVNCPSCGFANEHGALFCEQCKSDVRERPTAPKSDKPSNSAEADSGYAEALRRIVIWQKGTRSPLDLSGLGLTMLPPEIGQLTALTRLFLNNNRLTTLPPNIVQLTALTELQLQNNQLTTISSEIGQLTALKAIYLYNNELTTLPPEIGQLAALTKLSLAGNRFTTLPPVIGQLTALTTLDLARNQLTSLPPEIGQLTALTTLDLRDNQLMSLPPEIGQLTALTTSDFLSNQRTRLPPEIDEEQVDEHKAVTGGDITDDKPKETGLIDADAQRAADKPSAAKTYLYDVYVSYSQRDQQWVRGELLPQLQMAGLKVFSDMPELGTNTTDKMAHDVANSRTILVVLTPAYLESSNWAAYEPLEMTTSDSSDRERQVIPLLVEPCEVPHRFSMLNTVDFTNPETRSHELLRFVHMLKTAGAREIGQPAETLQNEATPTPQPHTTQRTKVLVVGSCKNPVNSNESKDFVQSCRLLGKALAEADFMVIVGSSSTTTADYHILDGANEADRRAEILIMRPTEEDDSAAREGLLTNLSIQRQLIDGKWKDIRDRQVQAADAVVVIGGGHGTQAVIRAARSAHKPLLPLGVISGPARAAWPAARATLLASGIGQEAIDILEKGFDAMVIVSVIQSLLLSPRSDPDGLFPVEHIRDIVSQSGELPTGEKVTGELLLFDNAKDSIRRPPPG